MPADDERSSATGPDTVEPAGSRGSQLRARLVPAAIVLAPLMLIAWCFWPGHMSGDTLAQIGQADSGHYTNQHAPILMALWHPFFGLGVGPGWILALQLVVFGLACYLLLRSVLRPVPAAVGTAALCMSPVVFGMLGYLSRDVWFTELTLLTFACVARAAADPVNRRRWVVAALAAGWLTLASRQNAAAAVFLAFAVLAGLLVADRWGPASPTSPRVLRTGPRRVVTAIVAGLVATVALMASQVAVNAAIGVEDVNPEQYLMIYDVAALSHQDHENFFPKDVMPARSMATVDRFWSVDSVNPYLFSPDRPIATPLPPKAVEHLRTAWVDRITGDPLGYLKERGQLMLRQLAIGRRATFIYHPAIDANSFGYVVKHAEADRQARDYVEGFADENLDGGVLYPLWLYLIAGVVAGAWLVRTRRPALVAVGALGLGMLTFQLGLFVATMGTQYRFEFPMVVSALICVIVAVAHWRGRRADPATSAVA